MYILFELCVTVSIKEENETNDENIKNNIEKISFKKSNNVAGNVFFFFK